MPVTAVYQCLLGCRTRLPRGASPCRCHPVTATVGSFSAARTVQRKRTVAASMPSGLPPVYKYCAGIIHCAEMQQRTLGCVVSVDGKRAEIPERLARQNRLFQRRTARFPAQTDADAALPYGRLLRTFSVTAYCHRPFKFCHCARTICGRGYSSRGVSPTGKEVDRRFIVAPPFICVGQSAFAALYVFSLPRRGLRGN